MQMVMPQDLKNLILLTNNVQWHHPYQQQGQVRAIAVGYLTT